MIDLNPIITALEARGITPHDLEETVTALILDTQADAMSAATNEGQEALALALGTEAETLTQCGLIAQVSWLACYYRSSLKDLEWALSGFLRLPQIA